MEFMTPNGLGAQPPAEPVGCSAGLAGSAEYGVCIRIAVSAYAFNSRHFDPNGLIAFERHGHGVADTVIGSFSRSKTTGHVDPPVIIDSALPKWHFGADVIHSVGIERMPQR